MQASCSLTCPFRQLLFRVPRSCLRVLKNARQHIQSSVQTVTGTTSYACQADQHTDDMTGHSIGLQRRSHIWLGDKSLEAIAQFMVCISAALAVQLVTTDISLFFTCNQHHKPFALK